MDSQIKNHYNSENLTESIKHALVKAGQNLSSIKLKDIAIVDQLHTGGARASIKLLKKAELDPGELILDAGCGIGGSSRLLAEQFGCRVSGIDLAEKFIEAARFLTRCTKLEESVEFYQGSITAIEFNDCSFDAVLCQHVLMNIEDKAAAVKELFRVLKPGGKMILHEITQGRNMNLQIPVPWASKASISFLEPWDTLAEILENHGFKPLVYADETRAALSYWEMVKKAAQNRKFNINNLGPGLIFGENAQFFPENMCMNLQNNAICLIETIQGKSRNSG